MNKLDVPFPTSIRLSERQRAVLNKVGLGSMTKGIGILVRDYQEKTKLTKKKLTLIKKK